MAKKIFNDDSWLMMIYDVNAGESWFTIVDE